MRDGRLSPDSTKNPVDDPPSRLMARSTGQLVRAPGVASASARSASVTELVVAPITQLRRQSVAMKVRRAGLLSESPRTALPFSTR